MGLKDQRTEAIKSGIEAIKEKLNELAQLGVKPENIASALAGYLFAVTNYAQTGDKEKLDSALSLHDEGDVLDKLDAAHEIAGRELLSRDQAAKALWEKLGSMLADVLFRLIRKG